MATLTKHLKSIVAPRVTRKYFAAITLGALGVAASGNASATLADAIAGLQGGDRYHVIFVTSSRDTADSTDIGVYNQRVINAAGAGSVTGSLGLGWSALASTGDVNAQANTAVFASNATPISFFNTNGDLVATSADDLWDGDLLAPVQYDEDGVSVEVSGTDFLVWTGTDSFGNTQNPLGASPARSGTADATGRLWMENGFDDLDALRHLYGISSEATVVPVPAALWLLGPALGFLGWFRRRS